MSKKDSTDIDWAAIVDLLASEYGWTIEYIRSLDLGQVISLKAKIQERYDYQNGKISGEVGSVSGEKEISESDFVKMGGHKRVREDGTTEIVL